jgi:aldehyde:ferredoxin oxidoreductase
MYSPPEEFQGILDEYYRLRDWDQNGIPSPGKLKVLGLDETIQDLHK